MSNSNRDLEKYYEILEVDGDASEEEIRRAYNHLKTLYKEGSMATQPVDNEWDETDKKDILDRVEEAYINLMAVVAISPEIETQIPIEDIPVIEIPGEISPFDREITEEEPVEEVSGVEIALEEPVEEMSFKEEPTEEERVIEETGEEIFVEEEPLEEETAVEFEIPPVVEEYRHEYIPEVHIEFEGGAFPDEYVEGEDELSGFFSDDETESLETEEVEEVEEIEEVEEVEVVREEKEENEEMKEDTLAEEFIEEVPGSATGSIFRDIRENRGFNFRELSESTQIPVEMLEHIENEDFAKLPDAGYLRWYITTYAKTLSMDPKETADLYMKRYREWKKSQD